MSYDMTDDELIAYIHNLEENFLLMPQGLFNAKVLKILMEFLMRIPAKKTIVVGEVK